MQAALSQAIHQDLEASLETQDITVEVALDAGAAGAAKTVLAECAERLSSQGRVRIVIGGDVPDSDLAALRNALWPELHVTRAYRSRRGRAIERIDVDGRKSLDGPVADRDLAVVLALRRVTAMSPSFTQQKFDQKASGWNGDPGSPGYGHFRWMRRLLSDLGRPLHGERVLDAGSGAGWVGVEAGLKAQLSRLAAFDPSPEMVRFVEQNAKANGLEIDARVGFVEDPPFAEEFDLVYNSGVISFAPDASRFLAGLDRVVRPGGRLIIGDLNPNSAGFARRRREKPVLPNRELNGMPREAIEAALTEKGYRVDFRALYQLTWPIPEIAHKSRSHLVNGALLGLNKVATAFDRAIGSPFESLFDSWIVGATKAR
jgi:SAM-dependent methyltransferase